MINLDNRGNKKGIREKIGQVLRIPLQEGVYGYAQMVSDTIHIFFDYKDDGQQTNVEDILSALPLFKITIDKYVVNKFYWEVLGVYAVKPEYAVYQDKFSYDSFRNRYTIWRMGVGQIPATWEEIKDLERLSSWGHGSVEQRLRDHFAGRPNYSFERSHNEHDPNFPKNAKVFYAQYGYDFTYCDNADDIAEVVTVSADPIPKS